MGNMVAELRLVLDTRACKRLLVPHPLVDPHLDNVSLALVLAEGPARGAHQLDLFLR